MLVMGSYSIVRTRLGGSVLKLPDSNLRLLVCGNVNGRVTVAESFFVAPAGCCAYALPRPQNAEIKKIVIHLGVKNLVKFQLKFLCNYKFFNAIFINCSTVKSPLFLFNS